MKLSPFEVADALDSLTVLIDTREQDTDRLRERLSHFPHYEREKLDAGDYGVKLEVGGSAVHLPVAVERKMSIDELCSCFCSGRDRFKREFERATNAKTHLHLLVENADWEKIYAGKYRSKLNPHSLIASILAWSARYNIKVWFCKPETSGKMIYDILHYEAREWLEHDGYSERDQTESKPE